MYDVTSPACGRGRREAAGEGKHPISLIRLPAPFPQAGEGFFEPSADPFWYGLQ